MGPSTRKRKETPSRTLFDFFAGAGATKRARVKTSQRAHGPHADAIVVVSDSDDSDNGKGCAQPSPVVLVDLATARSEDTVAFGAPSDLLGPGPRSAEASRSDIDEHQQPSAAPVVGQLTQRSQADMASHGSTSTVTGGDSPDDAAADFSIGEWAVGDDELASLEVSDNTAIKEGEEASEYSDKQCVCPVCGVDLTGILVLASEAETHVNHCLDTTLKNDRCGVQRSSLLIPDHGGPSTLVKGQTADLYTVLMNSHKENETWAEADATTTDRDIRQTFGNRRRAPFYKVLQGMPIAVDAFCYGAIPGVTAYFLTHAHSDHYTNLGSRWNCGPIYCSEETANLIIHMLAVDPGLINPLPLDTPTTIPNTGGVSVTLIEANHCPGSCLFLFEGQQTIDAGDSAFNSPFVGSSRLFRYLHCGDFRASPRHVLHPAVKRKHIDHIYLDTTYLDPKYVFPPQPLVISACAELARRLVGGVEENVDARSDRGSTIEGWMKTSTPAENKVLKERALVIVGTYSIGKERIVKAIARALETKIYCDPRKSAILRCQADKELHALLTADPVEANVHILPLGTVTLDNLRLYLQRFKGTFSRVVGFRPTGWTFSPPSGTVHGLNASIQTIISRGQSRNFSHTDLQPSQKSSHNIRIFGVPYSEHSSFFELTCFALSCDWGRMIPTVNVRNPTSRAKMAKWLKRWEMELKKCNEPSLAQPRTAEYW